MAYAFYFDVPGTPEMYGRVKEAIGDEDPKGLLVQLVTTTETGLRHLGVWESEADWTRYRDERVRPSVERVLSAVGVTPVGPPDEHELELVDIMQRA
jgi:hypothetical protein